MWLTGNESLESLGAQALQRKLEGTLNQIRSLQKQMSERLQEL
jgi:hypothetical protein